MTVAQLTFWWLAVGGSAGLTAWFYPAVTRHGASTRDAAMAAAMAGVLIGTSIALAVSTVVNAVGVVFR